MRKYLEQFLPAIAGLFLFTDLTAQNGGHGACADINRISLVKEIKQFISTAFIKKNETAETVYHTASFKQGPVYTGTVPDKIIPQKALVRFSVCNNSDSAKGAYFFPGFYYRSIKLFRLRSSSLIALPDSMPPLSEKMGYRYFSVAPGDTMTIVAELVFLKTYINKIRPRLIQPAYLESFITTVHATEGHADLVTFVFSGLLLMMVLYSLSVYLQGGNREFLYYSGYAFFTGFMLFTKARYSYHAEAVHFFFEEYLDFILQCTGIIFYMLFMQKFLNTKKLHPFLHKFYNAGVILLVFSILSYSFLHFATENYPLENKVETYTKMLLLVMIIIFLVYSLRHWDSKLLRFLFWGNLFYLFFSLISFVMIVAPQLLPLKGVAANALMHYEAGLFFELVFFLAGLNYKNRRRIIEETKEREALKAQNMLKEYEKEIAVYKAQQEERERISADMHDELGSSITAIRLMNEIARKKMKEAAPVEMEKISQSANDVLNKMNAIIWSMNSSNDTLDNLVSYIRAWSLEYFENTDINCRVNTPERIPDKELSGDKRRNLFLCVKETLNNTVKHSGARAVNIEIMADDKLCIRISDDGKGIDLEKLRQFGNGLKNIRRRMESIGGGFSIENNGGATTLLTLPL